MSTPGEKIAEGIKEFLNQQTEDVKEVDLKVMKCLGEFGAFTLGNAIGRLVREFGPDEADRMMLVYIAFISKHI